MARGAALTRRDLQTVRAGWRPGAAKDVSSGSGIDIATLSDDAARAGIRTIEALIISPSVYAGSRIVR